MPILESGRVVELFGPDMLADPYGAYARLRATDPVCWYAPQEAWVLTRYADVDAALRDARLSNTFGTAIHTPPEHPVASSPRAGRRCGTSSRS